jgi:hypothetical protein
MLSRSHPLSGNFDFLPSLNEVSPRHAAITEALDFTGGNVRAVQKFSRHRDVRVIERYDDNRTDLAGQVARQLAATVPGQPRSGRGSVQWVLSEVRALAHIQVPDGYRTSDKTLFNTFSIFWA